MGLETDVVEIENGDEGENIARVVERDVFERHPKLTHTLVGLLSRNIKDRLGRKYKLRFPLVLRSTPVA